MRYAMLAVFGSLAMLVAGCPSEPAPPEPSGTAVAESAYQQLKDANKVFDCSTAYDVINSAGGGKTEFDVAPIRKAAREYSDLNSTYRDRLSAIAFPPAAQPIAEEVRRLVTTQIQDLRWLTAVSTPQSSYLFINHVFYDEVAVIEELDQLEASLGHSRPQPVIAADQFELAKHAAQKDDPRISALFDEAVARRDIEVAAAVNRIQENTLQQYIDALETIDFPAVSTRVSMTCRRRFAPASSSTRNRST